MFTKWLGLTLKYSVISVNKIPQDKLILNLVIPNTTVNKKLNKPQVGLTENGFNAW